MDQTMLLCPIINTTKLLSCHGEQLVLSEESEEEF